MVPGKCQDLSCLIFTPDVFEEKGDFDKANEFFYKSAVHEVVYKILSSEDTVFFYCY